MDKIINLNTGIIAAASAVGKMEAAGPLGDLFDIKDETEGDYLINDDSEEDYDDDAEKYIGSVTVDVSNAILDYLNEHEISYAGA